MNFKHTFLILCLGCSIWGWSQKEEANNLIVDGNKYHGQEEYIEAEAEYRKAFSLAPSQTEALHNLGNTNYRIEDFDAASQRFFQAQKNTENKEIKHAAFHNMGNAYMKQKDYPKAVQAFKNALKNNPTDEETRYNYALAKELLKKEEQNKDNKDKEKDKKDQDKKDKEGDKGDSKEGEDDEKKDSKDGKDKEDSKEKKPKEPKKEDKGKGDKKEQAPKPRKPGQISPEQVKSLLKAMDNQEKGVQKKINAQKVKGTPIKTKKDW